MLTHSNLGEKTSRALASTFRCNTIIANLNPYVKMQIRYLRRNNVMKKETGASPSEFDRRRRSHSVMEKRSKQPLSPLTSEGKAIIRAPVGKADTGDYFALFEPVSLLFFERLER